MEETFNVQHCYKHKSISNKYCIFNETNEKKHSIDSSEHTEWKSEQKGIR